MGNKKWYNTPIKGRITKFFKNKEDAIKYRLYLEEKYQKEFSYNASQRIGRGMI